MVLDPFQPIGVFFLPHALVDLRAQLLGLLESRLQVRVICVSLRSVLQNLHKHISDTTMTGLNKSHTNNAELKKCIMLLFLLSFCESFHSWGQLLVRSWSAVGSVWFSAWVSGGSWTVAFLYNGNYWQFSTKKSEKTQKEEKDKSLINVLSLLQWSHPH